MNSNAPAHSSKAPAYAARMRRVLDYIDSHLDEELTLQQLSAVANFSPFHFHRQFSAYTGTSPARLVRLLRLRRASMRLAFLPSMDITEIALEAGYENTESFSRAFKQMHGQSPSGFRRSPHWTDWQHNHPVLQQEQNMNTDVSIVTFPTTTVAAVEYQGPESQSLTATRQLIAWRRENGVPPGMGKTYGVHYSDPATTPPEQYRLDVCVSYDGPIAANPHGVVSKTIPGGRCAVIRHLGSRHHIPEAEYLYREWLPASVEELRDFPIFFHYVNVGPDVADPDMVTDVYLPIR